MKKKSPAYLHLSEEEVKSQFEGKKSGQVFEEIYQKNFWESESASGPGSNLVQTKTLLEELPDIFQKYKIQSFLDIPCGDFFWMQHLKKDGIQYFGGDIVPKIVKVNQEKYGTPQQHFSVLDLCEDELPKVDLIFCRDCLVHLSYKDIQRALENIKKQDVKYLMTTTFYDLEENKDIITGDWRPLNFLKAPFNFPKPLDLLIENCTEEDGKYYDKSMGIWSIDQLP